MKGEICFDRVNFTYDDSKEVLHDINLTIQPGEKLALVGPSGGGKSTICHLIPNFYKLDSGEIRIDGTPIDKITFASLRKISVLCSRTYFCSMAVFGKISHTEI